MLTVFTRAPFATAFFRTCSAFASSPAGSTGSVYSTRSGQPACRAHASTSAIALFRRSMPALLSSELTSTSMSSLVTR